MRDRRVLSVAVAAFLFCIFASQAVAQIRSNAGIKHKFLAVDQGRQRLLYVDQFQPENDWTIDVPPRPRDLRPLSGNKVLMSHGNGAAEYDLKSGKQIWIIQSHRGIESAIRLSNGNTLLGGNNAKDIVIYEVDSTGKDVRRLLLEGKKDVHIIERLKNGHILLTHNEHKKGDQPSWVTEVDARGKTVWEVEIPGAADDVKKLPNGNTLVPTGDRCTVLELDVSGKTVATFAGVDAHPRLGIKWLGSIQVLKSGNMVVSNWLGHGVPLVGPHIIEFDRSNRIVWTWDDHNRASKIHNVLVLN